MIDEATYKRNLIESLNKVQIGWIDGDQEATVGKKADIVNHQMKIAIEIKDDTVHKTIRPIPERPLIVVTTSLDRMSTILLDHIRDAYSQFKNFPGYKTILLIRSDHDIVESIRYCIDGLHTYTQTQYLGKIPTKYTSYIKSNIGCFVLYNYEGKLFYVLNDLCKHVANKVTKEFAEEIFGEKMFDVRVV